MPYGTLRAFEEPGKASFEIVVKIAFALEAEDEFEAVQVHSQKGAMFGAD